MLQSREEGILNEIFRIFPVTQEAHRKCHCSTKILVHELAECVTVTAPNARENLAFAIGLIGRAKHERCACDVVSGWRRGRIPHSERGAFPLLHQKYGQGLRVVGG
jgi:hypothetical protein